jgi:branched-chain amino acid transport system substrate-binding protein
VPDDPRPEIKNVVDRYVAKYSETPDYFAIHAYDTMRLIAGAIELGGPTRGGVLDGLTRIKGAPSVIFGEVTFDLETRRVLNPTFVNLQIKDGAFVPWDGVKPVSQ